MSKIKQELLLIELLFNVVISSRSVFSSIFNPQSLIRFNFCKDTTTFVSLCHESGKHLSCCLIL